MSRCYPKLISVTSCRRRCQMICLTCSHSMPTRAFLSRHNRFLLWKGVCRSTCHIRLVRRSLPRRRRTRTQGPITSTIHRWTAHPPSTPALPCQFRHHSLQTIHPPDHPASPVSRAQPATASCNEATSVAATATHLKTPTPPPPRHHLPRLWPCVPPRPSPASPSTSG